MPGSPLGAEQGGKEGGDGKGGEDEGRLGKQAGGLGRGSHGDRDSDGVGAGDGVATDAHPVDSAPAVALEYEGVAAAMLAQADAVVARDGVDGMELAVFDARVLYRHIDVLGAARQ